jgi:aryl-alcohol dehydrogenase-like predicted oxidoreductase
MLGSHGPLVSEIGLGGWQAGGGRTWGPNASDDDVIEVLRRGFDGGATWIDTAEVYAQGRSEEIAGCAVQTHRDVRVFTKIGPQPDGTGVRAAQVPVAAEASLRRLGRDVIDLYQLHWRDPSVPVEETWTAMTRLVERGLVRWIGLSNVSAYDVEACARIRHVDSLQIQGSVLYRSELDWALPLCRRLGTGVLCYGPLAYGLLGATGEVEYRDWRSGAYGMDDFFVADNHRRFFAPDTLGLMRAAVRELAACARGFGLSTVQAGLAWVLAQPGMTGAIVGSRNADHVAENLSARTIELDRAQLAAIGAIGGSR